MADLLTNRWHPLRHHAIQEAWATSRQRFHVVPAGRRSGKTELAKRKLTKAAVRGSGFDRPRYFAAAPTRDQAKRIYWDDLKRMVPPVLIQDISETELKIELITGASLWVVGLDRPERIEGQPWDGGVVDEYANCKPTAWTENIRPALSDRAGWCDFIGVPEGYNHFYDLYQQAEGGRDEWAAFTWWSEDILPPSEIASAKMDLPEAIYRQEYQAEFISFTGRANYGFDRADHVAPVRNLYQPRADLILCLDFNVSPGIAVICQELLEPDGRQPITAVIGEVWIEQGSNTQMVMQAFLDEWRHHQGGLHVYGDQTGGAQGTAALLGSDWDIVNGMLEPAFGRRLWVSRPGFNPSERARLNAMNARLKTAAGRVGLKADPDHAPHLIDDLERVVLVADGSGKLDKNMDKRLTHPSDALGYYVFAEHPMVAHAGQVAVRGF